MTEAHVYLHHDYEFAGAALRLIPMPGIPDLDLQKIRRYAASVWPERYKDEARMEVDVRGRTVTILECRPTSPDSLSSEWTREGVARMKYDLVSGKWTLYWSDSNSRWHIYDEIRPGSIDRLLKEVESDPTGIFWG